MSLNAIGIVSQDLQASVRFYSLLGVTLEPVPGTEHYEGTTASGVRLMLDSVEIAKQLNPDWQEPVGSGVVLCFLQEMPQAVDALYNKLVSAGHASVKAPWDAFWGQRYASVLDPDGNQIDLFAPL